MIRRRAKAAAIVAALCAVATTSEADGPSYTTEPDVRLGAEMARQLDRIGAEFHERTGRRLHVTSGTRSPRAQARAMYDKIRLGRPLTGLYRDYEAASEIQTAYRRNRRRGRGAAVSAMARVIRQQMQRGCFVSRHLRASAADVRSRNLSHRERRIFREVVRSVGGVSLLEEGRPPHFHLQMEQ